MVRFLEDPEQYKTCEMIEHIDSSIQRYAFDIFFMLSKHIDFVIMYIRGLVNFTCRFKNMLPNPFFYILKFLFNG